MQNLFEKKVIKNRLHFIKSFNEKEWWYSGIQFELPDESNPAKSKTAFIGISEIRSIFMDSTAVVFFDGNTSYDYYLKKNCKKTDEHSLLVKSKHLYFNYSEIDNNPANGYSFELKTSGLKKFNGGDIHVNLTLKHKYPAFEKYDDFFENWYGLVNHFLYIESGVISINGNEFSISADDNNCIYQDHCFGDVPRKTKWHWTAVWNKSTLLDVLTNYGVYPQNYTEAFLPGKTDDWVRLNQDVSFECDDRPNRFQKQWKITSTHLDLNMEIIGTALEREAIPFSFLPLIINLFHYQCFARVWGKVLVQGKWIETGDMFGVFEEHHGKW